MKLSLIYVTHDQTEALTFADQVVVMTQGEVVQTGTPEQLFETPAHRFVGHFIGTPGMNFLECDWQGAARIGATVVVTASSQAPPQPAQLVLGIRPEYVEIHASAGPNCVPVNVAAIHDHGTHLMVQLEVGSSIAWSKVRNTRQRPEPGAAFAYLPADKCALYADDRRLA